MRYMVIAYKLTYFVNSVHITIVITSFKLKEYDISPFRFNFGFEKFSGYTG